MTDPAPFYLLCPLSSDNLDVLTVKIPPLLEKGVFSAFRLCPNPQMNDDTLLAAIQILCPLVQDYNVAFLLDGYVDLAVKSGCDGVHIDQSSDETALIRRKIGSDFIIGADCGVSRHLAMTAAEQGADYVSFGPMTSDEEKDLLSWWGQLMEIPSVAQSDDQALLSAGADFLALSLEAAENI